MLDTLLAAPVLVKVVGSLALILMVNRFVRNLSVSVAAGTLALGLWTGYPASVVLGAAWARLRSVDQLCLMGTIFLVIWLSSQMAEAGVLEDLVESVRSRLSRRGSMAFLPAVIGFLPMPGGALFSAPLVDRCDTDGSVAALLKTKTNYWFRHVWEYWWPLYPGVLLAIKITKLEMWKFMLFQMPLTVFAVAVGYVLLLRRIHPTEGVPDASGQARPRSHFLALMLPIIVVAVCFAAISLAMWGVRSARPDVPALDDLGLKFVPMMIGLMCGILTLQIQRPLGWAKWKPILSSRRTVTMVVIIAIILVFGGLIEANLGGGASLVDQMQAEIDGWAVHLFGRESELVDLTIIMLLPFIAGITTGVCIGFVGASFPVVVGLLGPDPSPAHLMAATSLAFGFGYMGMMLSPVHVCLIVTNQHFRTQLLHSLRGLLLPAAAVLALVVGYHFVIRWVGG